MKQNKVTEDNATLVCQAYEKLENMLVTLQLVPGQVISEQQLAQLLNIGRTPVREALQRLAREGLVSILPRRGIVVTELSVKNQLKALEIRHEIEIYLIKAAIKNASDQEKQAFKDFAQIIDNLKDDSAEAFLVANKNFYKLLGKAAKNCYATAALQLILGLNRRFWYAHHQKIESCSAPENKKLQKTIHYYSQSYSGLSKAIANGNEAEAIKIMEEKFSIAQEFSKAAISISLDF
jgi:DNA-binding GntR family transcriptional regulator